MDHNKLNRALRCVCLNQLVKGVIFPVEAGIHGCWASYPPDYQTFMTGLKFIICKRDCPLLHVDFLEGIARKARSGSNQLGNLSYLSRSSRPGTKLFPRAWLSIWVCQKIIMHPIFQFQWMRISFPIKVAICGYSPIFRQTHFNPRNSS